MPEQDGWLGPSYRGYGKSRYRMATKALHMLGDLSSSTPDLCYVIGETDTDYIGGWETGLGFIRVKFPKDTTRKLTQAEADYYRSKVVVMGSSTMYPIKIDDEDIEP